MALAAMAAAGIVAVLMANGSASAQGAGGTTFTVNSTDDPGTGGCDPTECTLREAIDAANSAAGDDIINVSATGTINLQSALPQLLTDMEINGPGSDQLTVRRDAGGEYPIFMTFANVTISGLTATNGNGGILVVSQGHSVTLRDVTVSANLGRGIDHDRGTLTLIDSTMSNNTDGGILNRSAGTLTLINSTVNGNTAVNGGGGIGNDGTLTLTNSTVSGNTGGGIFNNSIGTLTLTNSTLTDNSSGLAANLRNFFGTATFKNSIVANPKGGGDNCFSDNGPMNSQGHNLEHPGTTCGFTGTGDIQNQDPKLGVLANNGGKTNTHALLSGSPAIDAADNTGCPATDQRGVERPRDGDNNNTFVCDIGAFEAPGNLPSLPPPNDDFANAQEISGSSVSLSGTTRGATRETGEPDHLTSGPDAGEHSVWYSWTAPTTGSTTIDTCTANIDSILAVYTGEQLNALSKEADNNDGCASGTGSKVTFDTQAGTVYRIAVADTGANSESTFTLALVHSDTVAPEIKDNNGDGNSVTPADGAEKVLRNTNITIEFSEPMHRSTLESDVNATSTLITLVEGDVTSSKRVPAKVSCDPSCQTVTLDPFGSSRTKLAKKRTYTLMIEGGGDGDVSAVRDEAGNQLPADFVLSFKTGRK